ncbi:hypothetical protein U9M48_019371 [Paspalum notatum var. saurae]|uniref:Uncharacterized protein n=1 Tax=Paspalum notatum var. saurae TaxID=547442 RepID=A0AAQ3TC85_PASNO
MHDPREPHLAALKCILRYIWGTLHLGLILRPSTQSDLMVYFDADWAGCPDTHKSTSGYAVFLGDNLVSWPSKCQNTCSVLLPTLWLRRHGSSSFSRSCTLPFGVPLLSTHQRTKHTEIDLHSVWERVSFGDLCVLHVLTSSQYADIFTKGLPSTMFCEFRSSLKNQ